MALPDSADFVIVGSGVVGSLVARKLAQAGASVLILEAGPRVTRGELVARFRNSPRRSYEVTTGVGKNRRVDRLAAMPTSRTQRSDSRRR